MNGSACFPGEAPRGRAAKADDRRRRVLDAARKLFTERGFHAASVAQIAEESGVKVGQLYRDFESKEDIVAALAAADVEVFLDESTLRAAVLAGDLGAIESWVLRFLESTETDAECALLAEVFAEATRNPRVGQILHSIDTRLHQSLMTALHAIAPGERSGDALERLADLILALGSGTWYRRIADPSFNHQGLARYASEVVQGEIARFRATEDRGLRRA